jgi:hypothetical protein
MKRITPFAQVAVLLLAALPPFRIAWIVATNGENVLSDDYIAWAWGIDQILHGTYAWLNYFRDTFVIGGHSMAVPVLGHLAVARFAAWNMTVELFVGLGLFVLKLALLYALLAPTVSPPARWALLPLLSALVFSTSQISTFTFGDSSLQMGLSQVGFVGGLAGLMSFRGRPAAVVAMALGGLIASWSWGGGTLVWPVFLAGMWVIGVRRVSNYLVVLLCAALAAAPYVYFLFVAPKAPGNTILISIFNGRPLLNVLGRPLTAAIGGRYGALAESEWPAGIGLVFLSAALVYLVARRSAAWTSAKPALLIIAFSLLMAWQVTLFRSNVAPWYASPAMFFWIGLLGLAAAFWGADSRVRADRIFQRSWSVAVLVTIAFFYARSSRSWMEQSFYLPSRSPAAASCLRNFRTAPTYCEGTLFQWGVGSPMNIVSLGEPLERSGLSVFARKQTWLLQGDFGLGNVAVREEVGGPDVFWSADGGSSAAPWSDFRRLDVVLPHPSAIDWRISFPGNVTKAELRTTARLGASKSPGPLELEIFVRPDSGGDRKLFDETVGGRDVEVPISLPLTEFAGQTVTLRFTSKCPGGPPCATAVFRKPLVEIRLGSTGQPGRSFLPSNTDLSATFPKPAKDDLVFDPREASLWTATQVTSSPDSAGPVFAARHESRLELNEALDVCLSDFTRLFLRARASVSSEPRAIEVEMELSDLGWRSFAMTLLPDDGIHGYTYDLKLLEPRQGTKLLHLALRPALGAQSPVSVQLVDLRLQHDTEPSGRCSGRGAGAPPPRSRR